MSKYHLIINKKEKGKQLIIVNNEIRDPNDFIDCSTVTVQEVDEINFIDPIV